MPMESIRAFCCIGAVIFLALFQLVSSGEGVAGAPSIFGFTMEEGTGDGDAYSSAHLSAPCSVCLNGVASNIDFEWIRPVGRFSIVGLSGDVADCEELFAELQSRCLEYEVENAAPFDASLQDGGTVPIRSDYVYEGISSSYPVSMPCRSLAYLCRSIIARRLRSRQPPLRVSALVAGMEPQPRFRQGAEVGQHHWQHQHQHQKHQQQSMQAVLFWLDEIGSLKEVRTPPQSTQPTHGPYPSGTESEAEVDTVGAVGTGFAHAAVGPELPLLLSALDHHSRRAALHPRRPELNAKQPYDRDHTLDLDLGSEESIDCDGPGKAHSNKSISSHSRDLARSCWARVLRRAPSKRAADRHVLWSIRPAQDGTVTLKQVISIDREGP